MGGIAVSARCLPVALAVLCVLGGVACGPFEPFDCEPEWAEADCQRHCRENPALQRAIAKGSKLPIDDPCSARMTCHGCGDDVRFTVSDTQFSDIQVLSVFPAHVPQQGPATRVCGAVLAGEPALVANGLEFHVAMMSTGFNEAPCKTPAGERDRGRAIRDGDRIDMQWLTTTKKAGVTTVLPSHFLLRSDCIEPHTPAGLAACATAVAGTDLTATSVRFDKRGDRCDPKRPDTWQNVAVLMDHTGSLSGLVDANTQLEDDPDKVEPTIPIPDKARSDPFNQRIHAVEHFLDLLNDEDRAGVWYFDEQVGVDVACSDAYVCSGGSRTGDGCTGPGHGITDCPGGACVDDPSNASDKYATMGFRGPGENRQNRCFGKLNQAYRRQWFRNGLLSKAKDEATGRAPLWHATHEVFKFLSGSAADGNAGVDGPKHIVILTDRPDTCSESEHFNCRDLTAKKTGNGICRTTCAQAEADFAQLRTTMAERKWPVALHFVQFQSPAAAYRQPDARMQELACRSGGTYQFLNTEELNKQDPNAYSVVTTAMQRVRNVLGGSWRVGFVHPAIASGGTAAPVGNMAALKGSLKFTNSATFLSLNAVYTDSMAWRFGFNGLEDHLLTYRVACTTHADCGGTGPCAANRCLESGLCDPKSAADQQVCPGGRCCGGV